MAHGRSSFWLPMLLAAVVVYALISVSVAMATADKCDNVGTGQQGVVVPPAEVGVQAGLPARLVSEPRERPRAPLVRAGGRPSRVRLPPLLVHEGHRPRGRVPDRRPRPRLLVRVCSTSAVGRAVTPARSPRRVATSWGSTSRGRFVALAAASGGAFVHADARRLPVEPGSFDVALSLCQGGFGLLGGPGSEVDEDVLALREMVDAVRPGGRVVVSAFSAYFQVRHLDDPSSFDAGRGVQHEHTEVRDPAGQRRARRAVDDVLHAPRAPADGRRRGCHASTRSGRSSPAGTGRRHLGSTSRSSW